MKRAFQKTKKDLKEKQINKIKNLKEKELNKK